MRNNLVVCKSGLVRAAKLAARFGNSWIIVTMLLLSPCAAAVAQSERFESFSADPKWDGFRNRLLPTPLPVTRQNFGYRRSNHVGGARAGEIGGIVERSITPAYFAKRIATRTLNDRLTASGKLVVPAAEGGSGVMIGWFHDSSRGWRTPNSMAFRIDGNGGKYWAFYEYGTKSGRTGGGGAFEGPRYQTTSTPPFKTGPNVHEWSLDYDPDAVGGRGTLTFRFDDRSYSVELAPEHREEGATFNRFGIWNVQIPGDSLEIYLDDLVVDGEAESFDVDPEWDAFGNHVEFAERVIRPFHDFGYSPTAHCGSEAGEIGGIVFRDERPCYYAAPTGKLSLDRELRAQGRLALLSAGSDSAVYLGWFNSSDKQRKDAPDDEARQSNYLAILMEGPSRVGHFFRPGYATSDRSGRDADGEGADGGPTWPVVHPDGTFHRWSLHYSPAEAEGRGRIELTLDEERKIFDLQPGERQRGATFDRFGLFNLQSGGHHVELYLDDLSFTAQ